MAQPGYPSGDHGQPGYPPTYPGSQPQPGYGGYPGGPPRTECVSKIEVTVECRNLLEKDVTSKSDPCAAVFMNKGGKWIEMGRTENIKNNLNPKFVKAFQLDYYFEQVQKIRVAVYDLDNKSVTLGDDDFLGQIECTLGQVVSTNPFTKPLLHKSGKQAGHSMITLRAEERKESKEHLSLTFKAQGLDKKDVLGKSDPFMEISRGCPDGSWQVVHRTEVVKNNLNPMWRPFQISQVALCNNDMTRSIKIDCYDWDGDGSHDLIGSFTTTVGDMMKASSSEVTWPCINPKKQGKKKYQDSGKIILTTLKKVIEYSFLDFVMSGTQINFTVGVDFTASNGNPQQSTSLHYLSPNQPNEYSSAIRAVGDVCQDYDTDKLFPALGFGARLPPNWQVSHEFALNFNPQNPYCAGIDGVLQAYYQCIQSVQLYGPTNAAPIIYHVARFAAAAQTEEPTKGAHAYYILLLLSDGELSDMDETRKALVYASNLPFSLIIVGIGGADFSNMDALDGDNGVLRAPSGEPVKRDIVQFVPYRKFRQSDNIQESAAVLASHVLAEVPKQVAQYYKMRGIQPRVQGVPQ